MSLFSWFVVYSEQSLAGVASIAAARRSIQAGCVCHSRCCAAASSAPPMGGKNWRPHGGPPIRDATASRSTRLLKGSAGIAPRQGKAAKPRDGPDMSRQFLGRLLEDRHGTGIPGCGKAIGDGREGGDSGPQAFQAGHPALQGVYRVRPIELQVLEHRVDKRGRGCPPIDALAHEPEHAAADPVTAAFIADRFAPSAHAIRPSVSVAGPGHGAGAR